MKKSIGKNWLVSFIFSYFIWVRSTLAFFHPLDNVLLDCGGNTTSKHDDGRIFEPDWSCSSVTFSPISHNVAYDPIKGLGDLYSSARIFTQKTTYSFKIRHGGRHWLRLHLHPVKTFLYDLKHATFSIKADAFLLFNNFSFSNLRKNTPFYVKEYVIDMGLTSKEFRLVLSPSIGSIAFINGIELISMADNQFPLNIFGIKSGESVKVSSHVASETCYRINMGGKFSSSINDSFWRSWDSDEAFLANPASARSVSIKPSLISFSSQVSVEIAPDWVYSTAQEMADAHVRNQRFNMTWIFEVDSNFAYLIRLHFCDIVSQKLNNLIFNVYINNQTVLNSFDITSETKKLNAAYFTDFVVNVSNSSEKIMVQIGPSVLTDFPSNGILNGLEIMKLSNLYNSLDGSFSGNSIGLKKPWKKRVFLLTMFGCFGSFTLLGLIASIYWLCFGTKRLKVETSSWVPLKNHMGHSDTKISASSYNSSFPPSSRHCRVLSFAEICDATKNFDENLVVGCGGFGKVYKGVLNTGEIVAIKRGNQKSRQGFLEFTTEIEMLSKVRHKHLVSLIGYCNELDEMILIYEFMACGSLRSCIYGSDLPPLSWKQRLNICIGAAKGLHYLHCGTHESIIHRDVKTTNILLDENLNAKVSDFGLSKLGPGLDETHVSTMVKGSFGYLDPEYFRRQQLTQKSDVYSFGVVLLEILCARPAINPALPREEVNIVEWAMNLKKRGHIEQIIDKHLVDSVNLESLFVFGEITEKCLAEQGIDRPTMVDVIWSLEHVFQMQKDCIHYITEKQDYVSEEGPIRCDQEFDISRASGAFSQLLDPKGR